MWSLAWRLRQRLPALNDDVWSWETVSDDLSFLGQNRLCRFNECAAKQCSCDGAWRFYAEQLMAQNGLDKVKYEVSRTVQPPSHIPLRPLAVQSQNFICAPDCQVDHHTFPDLFHAKRTPDPKPHRAAISSFCSALRLPPAPVRPKTCFSNPWY